MAKIRKGRKSSQEHEKPKNRMKKKNSNKPQYNGAKKGGKVSKQKGKSNEVNNLSAKVLAHKNKNKAVQLMANPVTIDRREFQGLSVYEEINHLNILGIDEKSGAAFIEDWGKDSNQLKNHKILKGVKLVQPPKKQRLTTKKPSNAETDGSVSASEGSEEEEDEDILEYADNSKKKKKKKKTPSVKVTYDKPSVINGDQLDAKRKSVEAKTTTSNDDQSVVNEWDSLGIPEQLLGVISKLGFATPTQIQALSIPPAIRGGRDILGAAETGSGKTLAFGIPVVAGLYRDRCKRQEKFRQKEILSKLRDATEECKRKRAEALDSDEENELGVGSNDDEETQSNVDESNESDNESGTEEYLFNGPEGIMEVDYSELEEGKDQNCKKLSRRKLASKSRSPPKNGNVSNSEDDSDHTVDDDEESDLSGRQTDSDFDDTLEINSDAEQPYDSDDNAQSDEASEVGSLADESHYADEDDLEMNSDAEQSLGSDEEQASDIDDENDDFDAENSGDLGSDDEEDIEYDEDDNENDLKCVYAVNNVKFPFEEVKKPKFVESGDEPLVRALILTPTRELAVQIHQHLSPLCEAVGVTSSVVVGGFDAYKQKRILRRTRPELIVATPGRLWELIHEGVEHLKELRGIRYLAIDEADRMIDRKNFEEVHKIVRIIGNGQAKNKASSNRQTFVFSATLTLVHQLPDRKQLKNKQTAAPTSEAKLQQLAKMVGMKPSAKIFDVTREHATAEKLTECRINCEREEKDHYLYYFLVRHPGRTIVFCNSIEATRRLKSLFSLLKCNAQDLHASMHQKQRLRNLQQFSKSEKSVLITTDVAARGLDIKGVQHVVHYQVPFTAESYVHRSGRTARASSSGLSLVFVEPKDVLRFRQICKTLGRADVNDIPLFAVSEGLLEQVHERVNLATSLEKLLHQIRRKEEEDGARGGMRDAGLQSSDDEMDQEDLYLLPAAQQRLIRSGGQKGEVKVLQKQLDEAIKAPLVGSMFSFRNPTSKAALAAGLGTESSSIPAELIGINPIESLTEDADLGYMERYASELYGGVPNSGPKSKPSILLKQHRKDMAKLTKKLLRPEQSIKELRAKRKEKLIEKNKKKLEKKREKRKKKRMQKKVSK